MKQLDYEIVLEQEEDPDAGYSVYCPALPGCFSNGGTEEEAKTNMLEAIELYIESLRAHGEPIPPPRHTVRVEQVTVNVPE